jgi:hypothetical protein
MEILLFCPICPRGILVLVGLHTISRQEGSLQKGLSRCYCVSSDVIILPISI